MTRDTLLLTAVLLAAGFTTRTFAADDPPPVAAEAKPAGFDPFAKLRVREEQDEPPDKPATFERSDDEIKVFSLQNVSPLEVVLQLQVLFPESVKLSAVPSRKTVIARGPAEELRKVEALLIRLDETRPAPPPGFLPAKPRSDAALPEAKPSADVEEQSAKDYPRGIRLPSPGEEVPYGPASPKVDDQNGNRPASPKQVELSRALGINEKANVPAASPVVPGHNPAFSSGHSLWETHVREGRHLSLKGLRAEFAEHDGKARQVARRLRASIELDDDAVETGDLRDAVREAFDARQTLQRRELAELAERLAAIQKSLEARERMKDEIINRRVEELLNPALEWDNSPGATAKGSATDRAIGLARQTTPPTEDGIPLIAAVNAFNRSYTGPDHPHQPPLTEDEVVAAIRNWKHKRNEVAVSDAEFAAFLRIAETRRLPPGYVLGAHTEPARRDGKDVVVSSVLLLLPTPSRTGGRKQDYLIREILLDPETKVPLSERSPSATEQDAQAVEPIRAFEPNRSQPHTFANRVGHVTQVFRGEKELIVRCDSPGEVKKGDILEVSRRPEDDIGPWKRFAEVQITWVRRDHAGARVVSATPLRVAKYDLWMKPEPGDLVHKPDGAESAHNVWPPEDQTALRAQSAKNLKQIMLALHSYYDVYNHFPPAVVTGREESGKSEYPHSWRVAILPYFGRPELSQLYDQYRFDEPWDSEHNKALLTKMPDVYRSPLDEADSISTSYFAVVTPHLPVGADTWKRGTLFSNPQGTPMREVADGTSNTIAIVEAKRAVPWTKPEDIPFDLDGPVSELGGWFPEGFHAGFADGSVHFLSKENDAQTLRQLLLIQDGHVIEPPKLVE